MSNYVLKTYNELCEYIAANQTHNPTYFADKPVTEIADDFINAFMNDRKLPFASTPPAWLSADINLILASLEA